MNEETNAHTERYHAYGDPPMRGTPIKPRELTGLARWWSPQARRWAFDQLPTTFPDGYPHKKRFGGERFAYVVPITFGRARINVTRLSDLMGIEEFY